MYKKFIRSLPGKFAQGAPSNLVGIYDAGESTYDRFVVIFKPARPQIGDIATIEVSALKAFMPRFALLPRPKGRGLKQRTKDQ